MRDERYRTCANQGGQVQNGQTRAPHVTTNISMRESQIVPDEESDLAAACVQHPGFQDYCQLLASHLLSSFLIGRGCELVWKLSPRIFLMAPIFINKTQYRAQPCRWTILCLKHQISHTISHTFIAVHMCGCFACAMMTSLTVGTSLMDLANVLERIKRGNKVWPSPFILIILFYLKLSEIEVGLLSLRVRCRPSNPIPKSIAIFSMTAKSTE